MAHSPPVKDPPNGLQAMYESIRSSSKTIRRANGSSVTFEPGAWAAWHSHPLGQTLIVTAGCGLAQGWGEALPLTAYIALLFAAIALLAHPALALYIVSADMLVLLFVGIRNAWDLVIFLAVERSRPGNISSE